MSSYFSEADKQQVAYCLGCLTWAVNCLKMFAEDGQDMPASLGLAHTCSFFMQICTKNCMAEN